MNNLTKAQILDVMRFAGEYQREVYRLFSLDIVEITKYKNILTISVYYIPSDVSYTKLFMLFRRYFKEYRKYVDTAECYSILIREKERCAHFQIRFYA